ncbi:hypothetical protein GCM10020369_37010 [Cryptosporangium minutisporangium]|uniref:ATPase n=1 Tax=Cryptosporangium minutisporangium TaxID=113569 RepID=A0ABP6T0I7_9ACTN
MTPFVGRVAERAALSAALRHHRLVTAVGPGGVGKTRLALSVAPDLGERFADGVWYVDLVPIADPLQIASAIAGVLGLGERAGSSAVDDVLQWLADRETLLVLDNCEHLLGGLAAVLERLLAGSPRLAVLATSRSRLLVPFERVFPVPGLSVEADHRGPGDAVELFLGRAAAGGSPIRPDDTARVAAVAPSSTMRAHLQRVTGLYQIPMFESLDHALLKAPLLPLPVLRVHRALRSGTVALPQARALVSDACSGGTWGDPAVAAELVLSELVRNAVQHAGTDLTVDVFYQRDLLH